VDVVRFHCGETGEVVNNIGMEARNVLALAIKSGNIEFNSLKEVRSALTPYEDS
jgi:hypothetical protein